MDLTGSFISSAYVSVLTSVPAVSILALSFPFSSLSRESRFRSRDLERFLSRDRDLLDRFDFLDRDELRSLLDLSRLLLNGWFHIMFLPSLLEQAQHRKTP